MQTSPRAVRSEKNSVRLAEAFDVPRLVQVNHGAYPDLVGDNIVLTEAQIRAHLALFPRGQMVAEVDGRIAGGVSTFLVPRSVDPLRPHSWLEISGEGWFQGHDPSGDTLYLADIYIDPAAQGRGIGQTLYAALRDLCRERGLRRIVAGGRLESYHRYSGQLSPEQYIARVTSGEIKDRVLRSQLRAGFEVRGVLPNYLHDARSGNFASLLEWENRSAR